MTVARFWADRPSATFWSAAMAQAAAIVGDFLLLEAGDELLLESGDGLLLE